MNRPVSYIICTSPRSGSHFLSEALQSSGIAGKPDEYFICDEQGNLENESGRISEIYGQMNLSEFRDLVLTLGKSENGVFGIIIMWDYLPDILTKYRGLPAYQGLNDKEILDALFQSPQYIQLVRRNKAGQAVSWTKAMQTAVWRQEKGEVVQANQKPIFDLLAIEMNYQRICAAENNWLQFFEKYAIEPYTVEYETLMANYEDTINNLLHFLDISDENISFAKPQLQKQADGINQDWETRFLKLRDSKFYPLMLPLLNMRKKLFNLRNVILNT